MCRHFCYNLIHTHFSDELVLNILKLFKKDKYLLEGGHEILNQVE